MNIIIDNHMKQSKSVRSRKVGFIFFVFWIVIFILTVVLPQDILDTSPILRKFVNFMAGIFSPVACFGKYSEFSQVAQLVYSIEIVILPFLAIMIHSILESDLSNFTNGKISERPIVTLLIVPIGCVWIILGPLFFYPGKPGGNTYLLVFLNEFYHSKLIYSFGSVMLISGSAFLVHYFIEYFKGLQLLILKK
jgi:hypothetical protein